MNWKQEAAITAAVIIIMLLALVIISPIVNPEQKGKNNSTAGNMTSTSKVNNASNISKENSTAPTPKTTPYGKTMTLYTSGKI